jgi:hypothetical protein
MENKSISEKLTELHDLLSSGALTREEYDHLKSQMISGEISQTWDKQVDTSTGTTTEIVPGQGKPKKILFYSIIFVAVAGAAVATAILLTKKAPVSPPATQQTVSENAVTEPLKPPPPPKVEPVVWDETAISKIIKDDMARYPKWAEVSGRDSAQWTHDILSLNKISLQGKEILVGLVFSNYDNNYCNACSGIVSIYEFDNSSGLKRKSIAFRSGTSAGMPPSTMTVYKLSNDNWGLVVENMTGTQGEVSESKELYTFINDEFKNVFSIDQMYNDGDNTRKDVNLSFLMKDEGFCDLEVVEKVTPDGGQETSKTTIYKFDGTKYINSN